MIRARARVELEQIHQDAVEGDLISFEGAKPQFAIRDILLLTTFTAMIMMLGRYFGSGSIFGGILLSAFAWGWYFASARRRAHDNEIARRLCALSAKYGKDVVDELPVEIVTERVRE